MKAEIDTLYVNCGICKEDVEVPVMVEQGGERPKVTLTLQPVLDGLVAHMKAHMPEPEGRQ